MLTGVLSPPESYPAEETLTPVESYATSAENFQRLLPNWTADRDRHNTSHGTSNEEGRDSDSDEDDADSPAKRRRTEYREEGDSDGELGFEDDDDDVEETHVDADGVSAAQCMD